MGVLTGYVGALPSVIWGFGPALVYAPFIVLVAIWIYTLVFAFSALWYSHYLLSALADLRESRARAKAAAVYVPVPMLDATVPSYRPVTPAAPPALPPA